METLSIILLVLNVLLLTVIIILKIKLNKTRNEYYKFKRTRLRDCNKIIMLEYYLREYKNGKNIFTVFRDLSNLIYCDKKKDT